VKKKIKWIIAGLLLIGISGVLYVMSHPAKQASTEETMQQITFEATRDTLVSTIQVKGKSLYEQETAVYAPFSASIAKWSVQDGQQIKQGDVLFQLDQTELSNQIVQEEAALRKAKLEAELQAYAAASQSDEGTLAMTEAERKQVLVTRETARLNRELSEVTESIQRKTLEQKRQMLNKAQYRAPAAGIFLFEQAGKQPQAVGDNQYIGKIVDLNKLQFIALVGEQDVFRIKPDMAVEVGMTAMKDVKLSGKVLRVSKFAKGGTDQSSIDQAAQFEVVIGLEPSEYLIAGLSLNGTVETSRKENVVVLPSIAIIREQGVAYVMLDKGAGQLERKEIKLGMETPDKTEILEGVAAGDVVVLP
jgi:RND family efflux transporter MFP subunit